MKLQEDKSNGLISTTQYEQAVAELQWNQHKKKAKSRRKSLQSSEELERRKDLKLVTKWFFDVEIHSDVSALFQGAGDGETIVLEHFLPIVEKVIKYTKHKTNIANTKCKNDLVNTIYALVKNRRKNTRDRKKKDEDGNFKHKPLKSIYHHKTQLLVQDNTGASVILCPPQPLQVSVSTSTKIVDDTTIETPTTTTRQQDITVVQPMLIAEASATALPVITVDAEASATALPVITVDAEASATALPVITVDVETDENDNDILALQRQLDQLRSKLQKRLKQVSNTHQHHTQTHTNAHTHAQQKAVVANCEVNAVNTPVKTQSNKQDDVQHARLVMSKNKDTCIPTWIERVAASNDVEKKSITMTCRNADCGADFVVADAADQNGVPVLCNKCWDGEKQSLLAITSPTGAVKPNAKKRKATSKTTKKIVKKHRPSTPTHQNRLKRTITPSNPRENKFQV